MVKMGFFETFLFSEVTFRKKKTFTSLATTRLNFSHIWDYIPEKKSTRYGKLHDSTIRVLLLS